MTYSLLLKGGVLLLVLGALVWAIHSNGRAVERSECRDRENKELTKKADELASAMTRLDEATAKNAKLAADNAKLISEVTSHAAQNLAAAAAADAALRRDPVGLRIPAEICRTADGAMSAAADSAAVDTGTGRSGGVRLPSRIETGIYDLTFRANRTRIKRDECREFALGLARQRQEWENAQLAKPD